MSHTTTPSRVFDLRTFEWPATLERISAAAVQWIELHQVRHRPSALVRGVQYICHRLHERYWEQKLGIATCGFQNLEHTQSGTSSKHNSDYEPVTYYRLQRALNSIDISPERDVFVDIGSGKGRALIFAATYPIKRAVGIDISSKFNTEARLNLLRASQCLTTTDIDIFTADAAQFTLPDDASILFLNYPFQGELLVKIAQNIINALKAHRRTAHILFGHPEWGIDPFQTYSELTLIGTAKGYSATNECLKIYQFKTT